MHPPDGLHPWYVELWELVTWLYYLGGKYVIAAGAAWWVLNRDLVASVRRWFH